MTHPRPAAPPDWSDVTTADRLGLWFAALWLGFLLPPVLAGWDLRGEPRGVLGLLATAAFAALYLALWVRVRDDRMLLVRHPARRDALGYLAALTALGLAMTACLGEAGTSFTVFLGVAVAMVLPWRAALPSLVVLALAVLASGAVDGWGSQVGTAFSLGAVSLAVLGMRALLSSYFELVLAREENARLAVENERIRLARDLHDILGHSLTVITVKAELARRLLDLDAERARGELADLERLSRDALADVRRTVEGYREITLPGELGRARVALDAAAVHAVLPSGADDVPSELRELFAWTVREGVTNVVRHAGARTCEVRLTPRSAEVRDDGCGAADGIVAGSGLTGLRERAAALGATVTVQHLDPGLCLRVGLG